MITIKYLSPDDWMQWRDMRLSALGEAPYASALCSEIGGTKESSDGAIVFPRSQ